MTKPRTDLLAGSPANSTRVSRALPAGNLTRIPPAWYVHAIAQVKTTRKLRPFERSRITGTRDDSAFFKGAYE